MRHHRTCCTLGVFSATLKSFEAILHVPIYGIQAGTRITSGNGPSTPTCLQRQSTRHTVAAAATLSARLLPVE